MPRLGTKLRGDWGRNWGHLLPPPTGTVGPPTGSRHSRRCPQFHRPQLAPIGDIPKRGMPIAKPRQVLLEFGYERRASTVSLQVVRSLVSQWETRASQVGAAGSAMVALGFPTSAPMTSDTISSRRRSHGGFLPHAASSKHTARGVYCSRYPSTYASDIPLAQQNLLPASAFRSQIPVSGSRFHSYLPELHVSTPGLCLANLLTVALPEQG